MCRLQTFPDGLKFECGRTDAQKMLGNAVPSLLAEVLARHIRHQRFGEQCVAESCCLMPPVRKPIPPAEKVQPVPKKYHHYIGEHPAHPGERKNSNRMAVSESAE
jgi:DNA (cytosine-5)-methyltransferase 1